MQKVFEKIKERLEEKRFNADLECASWKNKSGALFRCADASRVAYIEAIEIVDQVAKEFADDINVGRKDGWIPCSERLPKHTDNYNVTVGVGNPFGYYETVMTFRFELIGNREPKWIMPNDNSIYTVIAWQPLPERYKEKK